MQLNISISPNQNCAKSSVFIKLQKRKSADMGI